MTDTPPARSRGRPRGFGRDQALRAAMQVFWTHGYEGASMTQLAEAMGIVSPSIYAAFGSKEDLFREAVELYVSSQVEPAWRALDEIADVHQAVLTMLLAAIDALVASDPPRGCLVMTGSNTDGSIRTFLRARRRQFRDRVATRLNLAVKAGDLPSGLDPALLAECVLAFFGGLSIEAADGTTKPMLRKSAELFCKQLFRAP